MSRAGSVSRSEAIAHTQAAHRPVMSSKRVKLHGLLGLAYCDAHVVLTTQTRPLHTETSRHLGAHTAMLPPHRRHACPAHRERRRTGA